MYIPSIPRISPKIVDYTIGQLNMAMDTATSIDDLLIITSISLGDFHIFSLNLAFINGFSQLDSCTWIFMDFHGFPHLSPHFFGSFPSTSQEIARRSRCTIPFAVADGGCPDETEKE